MLDHVDAIHNTSSQHDRKERVSPVGECACPVHFLLSKQGRIAPVRYDGREAALKGSSTHIDLPTCSIWRACALYYLL